MATKGKQKKSTMSPTKRAILTVFLVLLGIFAIYISYVNPFQLSLLNQWLNALFFMVLVGISMRYVNGLDGLATTGIYLLGTKHGLKFIDSISKRYESFWTAMSVWGIILGFGLMSYPFLRGKVSLKMYVFGLISLMFIAIVAVPATIYGLQFINLPQIQAAVTAAETTTTAQAGISYVAIATYAFALIFGFSGFIIFLLAVNAASVIGAIYTFIGTALSGAPQTTVLSSQVPGVAPLIPGIDVPLFETIIALVIIIVVHEFSHGILARIDKIKLRAIGLVFFGIIPIGAYVEPDEKEVLKLNSFKQSRIMAAGIASNMIVALIFMVLTFAMVIYVVPGLYSNTVLVQSTSAGFPAYNVIQPGSQILYWNGYKIENLSSFTTATAGDVPNAIVTVVTNSGTYSFKAIGIDGSSKGYIGLTPYEPLSTTPSAVALYFLYTVIVLTFMLNLFVGIVNLLPVPGFDGWRLYGANIKNKKIVNVLAWLVVAIIFINILPLFFGLA